MKKNSPAAIFLILVILFVGYITTFLSGIFFSKFISSPSSNQVTPTPSLSQYNPEPTPQFAPGKHYFDDTILLIEKQKPHRALIATITRAEKEGLYIQNTRVSLFDGTTWIRKTESKNIASSAIVPSSYISSWLTTIDESRVLKEWTAGSGSIEGKMFQFSTGDLHNEISMRSLPGYTKLMSEGEGKFTINDAVMPVNVLYTRIYSLNSADIQFYSSPLGLTTDWVAFWDDQGNFYHVDATHVKNPTPLYSTHQIGIEKRKNGSVTKTFSLDISRSDETPPNTYDISLLSPLNTTLHFSRTSVLNKMPNNTYDWFIGHVEGSVNVDGRTIPGMGIAEFIRD